MEPAADVVIFITAGTEEEGRRISELLLEQKKAACVSVITKVNSLFWWEGRIDSAQETLLIVKTKASQVEEAIGLVKEIHSYQVPEIIALPIVAGNRDYLNWIDEVLSK